MIDFFPSISSKQSQNIFRFDNLHILKITELFLFDPRLNLSPPLSHSYSPAPPIQLAPPPQNLLSLAQPRASLLTPPTQPSPDPPPPRTPPPPKTCSKLLREQWLPPLPPPPLLLRQQMGQTDNLLGHPSHPGPPGARNRGRRVASKLRACLWLWCKYSSAALCCLLEPHVGSNHRKQTS